MTFVPVNDSNVHISDGEYHVVLYCKTTDLDVRCCMAVGSNNENERALYTVPDMERVDPCDGSSIVFYSDVLRQATVEDSRALDGVVLGRTYLVSCFIPNTKSINILRIRSRAVVSKRGQVSFEFFERPHTPEFVVLSIEEVS